MIQRIHNADVALAGGTLVLMVPTAQGLVIAADSRITMVGRGIFCDNHFKIVEVESVSRTAFIVTGNSTVWNFQNFPVTGVCSYIRNNPPKFDVSTILKAAVEQTPALASTEIKALSGICVAAVKDYSSANPLDFDTLRGKQLFQVVFASYDILQNSSVVRSFSVNLNQHGIVSASDITVQEFRSEDQWKILSFGEGDYLIKEVFGGPGVRFLSNRYARFKNGKPEVGGVDAVTGSEFLSDIIEAASKTTDLIPADSGIGGPIDIILLGQSVRPQRLRWKSP